MEFILLAIVTVAVSALTFFTGFGLGTLLLPAFALFFPLDTAIAATAVVHLANNVFKLGLVGRQAHWPTVFRFGIPAALFAVAGALSLHAVSQYPALWQGNWQGIELAVLPVKLLIALLIAGFALLELWPGLQQWALEPRWVPVGGALSGFFGGLSGHQGALRSAFLTRLGLEKAAFVGTLVLCAIVVDVSRLVVYGITFLPEDVESLLQTDEMSLIAVGCAAAFTGSVLASRWLHKITLATIHRIIGVLLVGYAIALAVDLI